MLLKSAIKKIADSDNAFLFFPFPVSKLIMITATTDNGNANNIGSIIGKG